VNAVDPDLERLLGPTWEAMDSGDLSARAHDLQRRAELKAAGFTRALMRYMNQAGFGTAGEAIAALALHRTHVPHG
jgi:hypothetical protein